MTSEITAGLKANHSMKLVYTKKVTGYGKGTKYGVKKNVDPGDKIVTIYIVDIEAVDTRYTCLLYTSPSPRDRQKSRMPSSA